MARLDFAKAAFIMNFSFSLSLQGPIEDSWNPSMRKDILKDLILQSMLTERDGCFLSLHIPDGSWGRLQCQYGVSMSLS